MSAETKPSALKMLRYRIFRRFPGTFGQRYFEKYSFLTASECFNAAVKECAGMTCIDLGANIGEYSEMMAATAGRVIAFEPDPWTYDELKARVQTLSNIETINAAAGTEDCQVLLYRHEDFDSDPVINSQSSSVVLSKSNITPEGAHRVQQIDFLQFLRDLDEEIGVLKIDIEGAEVDLLAALFDAPDVLQRIHYVFAETHETRIPEHKGPVKQLHMRAKRIRRPVVNLYWH